MNPRIKFYKNWNKKLDCENFITMRLYTKDKYDYYYNNKSSDDVNVYFDVILSGEKLFEAWLMDVRLIMLKDVQNWLSLIDAGLYKNQFYDLMRKMYSKKPEWKDNETKLILLCFRRCYGDSE